MIRRDFIMRMVQQFMHALLRVMNFRSEGQIEHAQQAIDTAYRSALGCNPEFIDTLSAGEILEMMRTGVFSPEQVLIVARLNEEQAGLDGSDARLATALHLYLGVFAGPGSEALAEFSERIAELFDGVPVEILSTPVLTNGVNHFRTIERFDRAETLLFHAAERDGGNEAVVDCGRAFYDALGRQSDTELRAGGLSTEEVAQGRRDFEAVVATAA